VPLPTYVTVFYIKKLPTNDVRTGCHNQRPREGCALVEPKRASPATHLPAPRGHLYILWRVTASRASPHNSHDMFGGSREIHKNPPLPQPASLPLRRSRTYQPAIPG
jgi:hypothetical protein